jgi:hypothetical protein
MLNIIYKGYYIKKEKIKKPRINNPKYPLKKKNKTKLN